MAEIKSFQDGWNKKYKEYHRTKENAEQVLADTDRTLHRMEMRIQNGASVDPTEALTALRQLKEANRAVTEEIKKTQGKEKVEEWQKEVFGYTF